MRRDADHCLQIPDPSLPWHRGLKQRDGGSDDGVPIDDRESLSNEFDPRFDPRANEKQVDNEAVKCYGFDMIKPSSGGIRHAVDRLAGRSTMAVKRRHVLSAFMLATSLGAECTAQAATYHPDPANAGVLGTITDAIARAAPIKQFFVHSPAILAEVPQASGRSLLVFDSALELDTDGFPGDSNNPNWRKDTSLRYAGGTPLDADRIPYFVLPLPVSWPHRFGITLGDYAAVVMHGRVAFAVFGDQGPAKKLGEGALEVFRRLGQERLRTDGTVINAGTRRGVVTLVFPGSGAIGDRRDELTLLAAIDKKGRALFAAAGGKLRD